MIVPVAGFLIYDLVVDAFVKEEVASTHFVVEAVVFVAVLAILATGLRDLADLRGVKEGTARLQATSVYGKAGVHGRAEFVAEIVQELLTPIREDPEIDEAASGRESSGSTGRA